VSGPDDESFPSTSLDPDDLAIFVAALFRACGRLAVISLRSDDDGNVVAVDVVEDRAVRVSFPTYSLRVPDSIVVVLNAAATLTALRLPEHLDRVLRVHGPTPEAVRGEFEDGL
jgi:hypothetical protein